MPVDNMYTVVLLYRVKEYIGGRGMGLSQGRIGCRLVTMGVSASVPLDRPDRGHNQLTDCTILAALVHLL